jgi:hypothetical protein
MMRICVNPNCRRPLSSFSEGRLFQFEIVAISVSANDESKRDFDELPRREKTHFWLCGRCSTTMRLALEPLEGLRIIPLEPTIERAIGATAMEPLRELLNPLVNTQAVHHPDELNHWNSVKASL